LREHILDHRFPRDRQIADSLRAFIDKTTGAGSGPVFRNTLEVMIQELRNILTIKSEASVSYLRPLADLARRQPAGLVVATLNYDLAVETMCESSKTKCSTGIERWTTSGRWKFPASRECVQLLKLHGSINWLLRSTPTNPGSLPEQQISVEDDPKSHDQPAIVFGQTKLRPDGPFIELLVQFIRALERIDHLVVVGYSFRDEHVNEQIRTWLNADSNRTITVVDPSFPPGLSGYVPKEDFRSQLQRSLIPDGPTIIGGETIPPRPNQLFEARLEVIRDTAARALPQVLGESAWPKS
jgi:hypothetical protein